MKLLFDENLSPRLVQALADLFPDSNHVRNVGLKQADDETVWKFCIQKEYVLVSKDADFHQRSFLFGHPPKVIWIRRGNCATVLIERILRERHKNILSFVNDEEGAFLALS